MFKELSGHFIMGVVLAATLIGVVITAGIFMKMVLTSVGACD